MAGRRARKDAARAERAARAAEALRANLRRRKAQARARAPEDGPARATDSPPSSRTKS